MKDLSAEEAEELFSKMISGAMPENEIREILTSLNAKGESADEIYGAVRALQKEMLNFDYPGDLIDVCGTGGDGWKTLNISTAVSFVIAACGLKVVKHGNRAISSISGSSDVLTALGVNYKPSIAKQSLDETNFCYLHAPDYHPALKSLASIRQRITGRTIFNLIGPLLNPARPQYQLIGVYDQKLLPAYGQVLAKLKIKKAWIVYGDGGLDELSGEPKKNHIYAVENDKFVKYEAIWEYEVKYTPMDLIGGTPQYNADLMVKLLSADKSSLITAYREIVLLNSAAALLIGGKVKTLEDGIKMAKEAIDSGKAKEVLEKLKKITA